MARYAATVSGREASGSATARRRSSRRPGSSLVGAAGWALALGGLLLVVASTVGLGSLPASVARAAGAGADGAIAELPARAAPTAPLVELPPPRAPVAPPPSVRAVVGAGPGGAPIVAAPVTPPEPTSELAALLPPVERGAAVPDDAPARARPVGVQISSIDVSRYPVRSIGLDDGALEIPDETEIGWYRYGSAPGLPGSTVLAAHVSWNRTIGPFFELADVAVGDRVEVALDDGTARWYRVTETALHEKDELPGERIWRTTGPEELVLITCGGDFQPQIRRFRHNVVVYAEPA